MNEGVIQGTSVSIRKPSVSEHHYSSPSISFVNSALGMEEETHFFTWSHRNQNLPIPSRALKKQLPPDV